MQFMPKNFSAKKEWEVMLRKEARLVKKQAGKGPAKMYTKLDDVIPARLHDTMNAAFRKAFVMVFEKVTIKSFTKNASIGQAKNLVISGIEGIGLGTLGIGIPDIPIFIGVLLKSIYEIALSYGFSYDTESEKFFILNIIRTAMEYGDPFQDGNHLLNTLIRDDVSFWEDITKEITLTSAALSEGMLYMKFVQGIPLVGMAGGLSDAVYLKKITDYAQLKYQRRFLWEQLHPQNL